MPVRDTFRAFTASTSEVRYDETTQSVVVAFDRWRPTATLASLGATAMRLRGFRRFNDLLGGNAEAQMFGGNRASLIRCRNGAEISGGSAAKEADTPAEQNAASCRKPRARR
jgi:hypothetical protein